MKNPKFQIYTGNDGKFYFRLYARNGQQVLSSQGYASKNGCTNGIDSVKTNAPDTENFELKQSTNGKYYFNLLAANKQVIGSSQMYATAQTRMGGIDAVQRAASGARVEDTTS